MKKYLKHKVTKGQVVQFMREAKKVYHFSFLQNVEVFDQWLKSKHFEFDHALACIRYEQDNLNEDMEREKYDNTIWHKKAKKCPQCGELLGLKPIVSPPGPSNVKGYRSLWYCQTGWREDNPEGICGYESYSMQSMNKVFKKMGIKARVQERW